jgi:hypothetical protein
VRADRRENGGDLSESLSEDNERTRKVLDGVDEVLIEVFLTIRSNMDDLVPEIEEKLRKFLRGVLGALICLKATSLSVSFS